MRSKRRVWRRPRVEFPLNLLEQRLEAVEILAFLAVGDFLGRALLGGRADMAEFGDVGRRGGVHPELGQKLVIVEFVDGAGRGSFAARQKPLMIQGCKQRAAFVQLAETVEAHGIQPLEDVAILAVLRGAAVLLDETLNFLEAGDDALLARRPARSFFVSTSTPSSSRSASSSSVNLVTRGLRPSCGPGRRTPSAMRFSQASGEVIEGSRPRSFLNFKARLASSRASSIVRLMRLAAIAAATCFRLSSLMVLARMA